MVRETAESQGRPRRERAAAVADDLGQIFQAAPSSAPPPRGRVRAVRAAERAPSRAGRWARWGGLAGAALLGVAAGAVMMDPRGLAPETGGARLTAPVGGPAVPVTVAEAPQAPVVRDLPAPVFTPVASQPPPAEASKAQPAARIVKAKAKAKAKADDGPCAGLRGSDRARCAYPQVLDADRRLRRAYAQATRAGVERARLVSYRNRWDRLRHRADDQPARVIAAYGDMARDLSRLARDARS
ncbi:hypothetical protein [Phenylobacterium sp.]|jgi:hypothetical protein|uniref:hypothetical protein n=1 Tax=Phenylobacterium sp. TaxID=1871053 RepID=UPI002F94303B